MAPSSPLQPVPLTSVATPADKLGRVIAKAVQSRGEQIAPSPLDITCPPLLVIRRSCGPALQDATPRDGAANDDAEANL